MVAPPKSSDPFDEIDIREDVRHLLLGLAPRQRAALVLLDLYDYGSEEAAQIMGIRPSTVRALATQGRAVLTDLRRFAWLSSRRSSRWSRRRSNLTWTHGASWPNGASVPHAVARSRPWRW